MSIAGPEGRCMTRGFVLMFFDMIDTTLSCPTLSKTLDKSCPECCFKPTTTRDWPMLNPAHYRKGQMGFQRLLGT